MVKGISDSYRSRNTTRSSKTNGPRLADPIKLNVGLNLGNTHVDHENTDYDTYLDQYHNGIVDIEKCHKCYNKDEILSALQSTIRFTDYSKSRSVWYSDVISVRDSKNLTKQENDVNYDIFPTSNPKTILIPTFGVHEKERNKSLTMSFSSDSLNDIPESAEGAACIGILATEVKRKQQTVLKPDDMMVSTSQIALDAYASKTETVTTNRRSVEYGTDTDAVKPKRPSFLSISTVEAEGKDEGKITPTGRPLYHPANVRSEENKTENICPSNCRMNDITIDKIHQGLSMVHSFLGPEQQRVRLYGSYCNGPFHFEMEPESRQLCPNVNAEWHGSIGKIMKNDQFIGTCFRVGSVSNGFIITCFHVFMDLGGTSCPKEESLAHPDVQVTFFDSTQHQKLTFHLKPELYYGDPKFDVAVLELQLMPMVEFPIPFQKFDSIVEGKNQHVFILGYQNDTDTPDLDDEALLVSKGEKMIEKARQWSIETYNEDGFFKDNMYSENIAYSIDDVEKTLICSKLRHGASGGPVFYTNEEGEPVVVAMFQGGYPFQYYTSRHIHEIIAFPACSLIEQGVIMKEIYNSMTLCNYPKFRELLFGNCFK